MERNRWNLKKPVDDNKRGRVLP